MDARMKHSNFPFLDAVCFMNRHLVQTFLKDFPSGPLESLQRSNKSVKHDAAFHIILMEGSFVNRKRG